MAGYTFSDQGACNCPGGATCTQTITVLGCNGQPYAGLTVSVYTASGGTLLGSGTTDGSGQVTLSWTGVTGSYWVTVTGQSTRFAAYAQSVTLICPSHTTSIALTPATGYHCANSGSGSTCLLPLKDTLTWTSAFLGTVTLTWGTSPTVGWHGTVTFNVPACSNCPACPVNFTVFYDGGENSSLSCLAGVLFGGPDNCPVGGLFAGSGTFQVWADNGGGGGTLTCPPAFDFTCTFPGAGQGFYCGVDDSIGITE